MNKMTPYRAEMDGNTFFNVKLDPVDRTKEEFAKFREFARGNGWEVKAQSLQVGECFDYCFFDEGTQKAWDIWRAAVGLN